MLSNYQIKLIWLKNSYDLFSKYTVSIDRVLMQKKILDKSIQEFGDSN